MSLAKNTDELRLLDYIIAHHKNMNLHPPETKFFRHLECRFDHLAYLSDCIWNSRTKNDPMKQIKREIGYWYDHTISECTHKALKDFLRNSESYGIT